MKPFIAFIKNKGLNDFRRVTASTVDDYSEHLASLVADERLAQRTAINRLSSLNVCLRQMRTNKALWRSPSEAFGRRRCVRSHPPLGMDRSVVVAAANDLTDQGHQTIGYALLLARTFGMRIRETALLWVQDALHEVERDGAINVIRGAKGGRKVERRVTGGDSGPALIQRLANDPVVGRNLITIDKTWVQWSNYFYRIWRPMAPKYGLSTGLHDLRVAYACDRYNQLTGYDAPVIAGKREASKDSDRAAREILAKELGHGRTGVVASYIGSAR